MKYACFKSVSEVMKSNNPYFTPSPTGQKLHQKSTQSAQERSALHFFKMQLKR